MQLLYPYFKVWCKLFSTRGLIVDLRVSNWTQAGLTVQATEQYEKILPGQESSLNLPKFFASIFWENLRVFKTS